MTYSVLLSSCDLIAASQKMRPAITHLSNRTPTVPVSEGSGRTETPAAEQMTAEKGEGTPARRVVMDRRSQPRD
jgi:hypothetical protein